MASSYLTPRTPREFLAYAIVYFLIGIGMFSIFATVNRDLLSFVSIVPCVLGCIASVLLYYRRLPAIIALPVIAVCGGLALWAYSVHPVLQDS